MSTRSIVPRVNGEGGIGTLSKRWGSGHFQNGSYSQPVSGSTPTLNNHLATKDYVDSTVTGGADKITEGDSKVEVVDTGSGYIAVEVDGSEVARWDSSGLDIKSDILPDMTGGSGNVSVHSIGASGQRLAHLWAEEVHTGAGSLWVNNTELLQEDGGNILIQSDSGQDITVRAGTSGKLNLGNSGQDVEIVGNLILQSGDPISEISNDTTLSSASTAACVTEYAIKEYVDNNTVNPSNVRKGRESLSLNDSDVSVTFGTAFSDANYTLVGTLTNTSDSPPSIYSYIISSKDASGFTMTFSGEMDSGNYVLEWRAEHD
jgi:hypothetical protein